MTTYSNQSSKRDKKRCASDRRQPRAGWRDRCISFLVSSRRLNGSFNDLTLRFAKSHTGPAALALVLVMGHSVLSDAHARYERDSVPRIGPSTRATTFIRPINLQQNLHPYPLLNPVSPADEVKFGILGSMEFKVSKHKFKADWDDVVERTQYERARYEACETPDAPLCPPEIRAWRKELSELRGLPKMEQVTRINRFVNHHVSYADDEKVYGKADYWAIPTQTLQKSGDCEDYAILKFFSLLELGFTNDEMRLAIVRDRKRRVLHAVVSVNVDGKTVILDSLFDRPVSHQYILKYVPLNSWNLEDHWAHIVTKKIRLKFVKYIDKLASADSDIARGDS